MRAVNFIVAWRSDDGGRLPKTHGCCRHAGGFGGLGRLYDRTRLLVQDPGLQHLQRIHIRNRCAKRRHLILITTAHALVQNRTIHRSGDQQGGVLNI
ncbi:hypothetical protein C2W62_39180 [Candidatus Entotheonella serta]|nr:hypothetical protein C2W62_39180 [Candidatus Entotheonella serta]